MSAERPDNAEKAFHYLVADALEALIPMVDTWADEVKSHPLGDRPRGYVEGYEAGVERMAAELKDQLVERILVLRQ
jgi:hypothetical protein